VHEARDHLDAATDQRLGRIFKDVTRARLVSKSSPFQNVQFVHYYY
jgi:hypothetical protein